MHHDNQVGFGPFNIFPNLLAVYLIIKITMQYLFLMIHITTKEKVTGGKENDNSFICKSKQSSCRSGG